MPERSGLTVLNGTIAPLLTVSTKDIAAIDASSIWINRMWKKSTPFVIDTTTLQPVTSQSFGSEMVFDIPKQCHAIKNIVLHVTVPASTVVPAGTAMLVDHFGYALIEYMRMMFGANLCYEVMSHDMYFKLRKNYGIEKRDAINEMVGGDLSAAQRTADLANGREYYISMFLPHEEHQSKCLPLLTLSQKLRILLKTRAFQNLYNASVGTTVTMTPGSTPTFELIMKEVHLMGNEAQLVLAESQGERGISYMIHQHIRQNSDDVASTQNGFIANIRMTSFTKPMKNIFWALIPTKLINDTGRNDMFFFKGQPNPGPVPAGMTPFNPPVSWSIAANGQIIQRTIPYNYSRVVDHYLYTDAPHGEDIFNQFYNEYNNSFNAAIGYCDYTNYSNPVLTFTFGTGGTGTDPDNPLIAQSLRVLINGQDYNFWYFQNGNFTRTFN